MGETSSWLIENGSELIFPSLWSSIFLSPLRHDHRSFRSFWFSGFNCAAPWHSQLAHTGYSSGRGASGEVCDSAQTGGGWGLVTGFMGRGAFW